MNFRKCKKCNDYKLILGSGKCNGCLDTLKYNVKIQSSEGKVTQETISIDEHNLKTVKNNTKSWVNKDSNEAYSVIFDDDNRDIFVKTYITSIESKSIEYLCERTLERFINSVNL